MDRSAIYHKSARGAEVIATRNAALPHKLRSMLILVNGKRPYAELCKLGQGLGDPSWLLAQLEAECLIEPGPARAGPPSEPAPLFGDSGVAPFGPPSAPAPLQELSPRFEVSGSIQRSVPLQQAQRFAIRCLLDMLGPTADDLCERIEAARSAQEFRAAIRSTETMLRKVIGPELAEQFVREVETQRPS